MKITEFIQRVERGTYMICISKIYVQHLRFLILSAFMMLGASNSVALEKESEMTVHFVSFLNLVANPNKYNGQWVHLTGYYIYDPDGGRLFMAKEYFKRHDASYSIALNFSDNLDATEKSMIDLNFNYVTLICKYYMGNGKIESIGYLSEFKQVSSINTE